jgi:hypothetical protein
MTVSPFAGKPAQASMLVNVPRLVTAYYTDVPDPSVPEQRVAFGTSGLGLPESFQRMAYSRDHSGHLHVPRAAGDRWTGVSRHGHARALRAGSPTWLGKRTGPSLSTRRATARPSGTEDIYKIYAESFRGADHLRHLRRILEEAQTIVSDALAASPQQPGIASKTNMKRNHEQQGTNR